MNQKLKNKRGITLIALVVTIVVLLILAGVSISLILDNNGIIQKSKNAKLETRASQVEDEIGLWKQNNFIKSEAGESIENANFVLESLISRGLLEENEIDRENEIITIKKKDGTIVKEISYGSIRINISKIPIQIPETEKSLIVLLKIESVEGLTIPIIKNDEELNNFINSLSEMRKKEIIRNEYIKEVNKQDTSANCTTFQDVLDWLQKNGGISEATEMAFWNEVESRGGIDKEAMGIMKVVCYNEDTKMIEGYTVTNPDNDNSDTYIATANGTYTFKIQDIVTGKTYTKKVDVNNIETTSDSMYKIVKEGKLAPILLHDVDTNIATTFEKAYIRYNNEIIDITDTIRYDEEDKYNYLETISVGWYLEDLGKMKSRHDICYTNQLIIIIRKNKVYAKEINMGNWQE